MRVAIVAESFLPQCNGVVNSVLRVVEHLEKTGHEAVVVAPDTPRGQASAPTLVGRRTPVHLVPSVMVPKVTSLPIGVPTPSLYRTLRDVDPDVVHLASPFVIGAAGAVAARRLDLPSVAVFQTDVAGFAESYGLAVTSRLAWRYTRRLHEMCDRTLAPSTETLKTLAAHGVPRLHRWGRGVDVEQFDPAHVDPGLRADWSTGRREPLLVGFVGRLAPEKHVERLASVADDPSVRLVIVGDGPERARLEALMPHAVFTGELRGAELARVYASLDVFVHAGSTRRSVRPSRRRWPAACRWSGRTRVVRATWSGIAGPATCCPRASSRSGCPRFSTSCATVACAPNSAALDWRRSGRGPGPRSAHSWSIIIEP
ncbi:GDP-mannose-dependent alpha-mannosyltransferase [Gordonia insulae]|uniref:GDP-mannose-dependent alpha-mannosyltransferase n=1 Tax=Gordonia insulae TaxID=2420509 RepID=A0A3G8JVF2_9ACTN|nr:GDP-mannose-dependent alpha-mannosyltransferase [Gordonia insulae]